MEININEIDVRIEENEKKKEAMTKDTKSLIVLAIGHWLCTIGMILLTIFSYGNWPLFVCGVVCSLLMLVVSFFFGLGIWITKKDIERCSKLIDILYDIKNLDTKEKQSINNIIIQDGE